jgi:hypothetical protein
MTVRRLHERQSLMRTHQALVFLVSTGNEPAVRFAAFPVRAPVFRNDLHFKTTSFLVATCWNRSVPSPRAMSLQK